MASKLSHAANEPLLVDVPRLAALMSVGERTVWRLDAARTIPGRMLVGRRVVYSLAAIRQWIASGMPTYTADAAEEVLA